MKTNCKFYRLANRLILLQEKYLNMVIVTVSRYLLSFSKFLKVIKGAAKAKYVYLMLALLKFNKPLVGCLIKFVNHPKSKQFWAHRKSLTITKSKLFVFIETF